MWNTQSVQLDIRLPKEIATEAEKILRTDPDFFSRMVRYSLTRRAVYQRLREDDGRSAAARNVLGFAQG